MKPMYTLGALASTHQNTFFQIKTTCIFQNISTSYTFSKIGYVWIAQTILRYVLDYNILLTIGWEALLDSPCPKHTVHCGFAFLALPFLNFSHPHSIFYFGRHVLFTKTKILEILESTSTDNAKTCSNCGATFPAEYDGCPSCGHK